MIINAVTVANSLHRFIRMINDIIFSEQYNWWIFLTVGARNRVKDGAGSRIILRKTW
jgi:hypothetical protein